MKTCSKCGKTKPFIDFPLRNDKRVPNVKYKSHCKECEYNKIKLYRDKNKQKTRDYSNKYVDKISNSYAKEKLRKSNYPITEDTIKLKRLQILTNRILCKTN